MPKVTVVKELGILYRTPKGLIEPGFLKSVGLRTTLTWRLSFQSLII